MTRIKILWTSFALLRLDEIHDFIADKAKSFVPAQKITKKIIGRTDQLIEFPDSGQTEPFLHKIGQNSRYLLEGNYKIIYEFRKGESTIIITDIFHTKQYPGKLL